jgi:hypothetical protein
MRKQMLFVFGLAVTTGCSQLTAKPEGSAVGGAQALTVAVESNRSTVQVIAYYFHGTVRCETCLKIEERARELIGDRFGAEIGAKWLAFKSVNYDEPTNAHFLTDYKLPCPSLVLVRQRGGKDEERKLLGQTWEMVQIPPKLDLYIEEEVRMFLGATNSPPSGGTNSAVGPACIGTNITALAELGKLAGGMNAVMVFLPPRSGEPPAPELAAVNEAQKTLEGRFGIKIGLFTLGPGARDYEELAPKAGGPAVVAIVKTGVKRCVSGELTEERVIEGFMGAVSAGGCCPLGYPGEER